ncbi:MAG: hypothetical protein K2Z81_19250, partial [Cyanobacteria bacterium]|nr:hypothetical protein [Cyanobacteriota bacterium]
MLEIHQRMGEGGEWTSGGETKEPPVKAGEDQQNVPSSSEKRTDKKPLPVSFIENLQKAADCSPGDRIIDSNNSGVTTTKESGDTLQKTVRISAFETIDCKPETMKKEERISFNDRYLESTQETLVGLYAKRDTETGLPIEDLSAIVYRVAQSIALAELKYCIGPEELVNMELEQALAHPQVVKWAGVFADHIGNQKFWANTPANINADPEVSLQVLQYWAHGTLEGLEESSIWLVSEELRQRAEVEIDQTLSIHKQAMARIAKNLRGRGCLAACGVAYVKDSLEGIQEAARIEALAAKAAMGMGLNTSTLRPWSSIISNGAAASGPDRFYEKTIAKAVEAVAQGGRRGGALIELRNS